MHQKETLKKNLYCAPVLISSQELENALREMTADFYKMIFFHIALLIVLIVVLYFFNKRAKGKLFRILGIIILSIAIAGSILLGVGKIWYLNPYPERLPGYIDCLDPVNLYVK